ncbi:MAG TPA: hypothetical protein VJT67_14060 [Longimicrobiaceae bacterium]|nr:hypothetical protein [Longimicrobiaceae bacterium]
MDPPEPLQPETLTLREARARFFAENGFDADGGYTKRWFRIESRPLPVYLPNLKARVDAVRLHDLHHIVAGYATDWPGEAEIGAWEIASGCGRYWAAWLLNFGSLAFGVLAAPRRTYRAFMRGRRCTNLYGGEFHESLLDESVGALRRRLGLARPPADAPFRDRAAFAAWGVFVLGWHAAGVLAALVVLYLLLAALGLA